MLLIQSFQQQVKWTCLLWVLLSAAACKPPPPQAPASTFHQDSLQVEALLHTGDSLYALRSGLSTIESSMLYFDSAHRIAQRLGDTALLAQTLYYIGNVYNAWNREPQTTIDYYQQAAALFQRLAYKKVKEIYLRYIIAHAYDSEKMNDSLRCIQTIQRVLQDMETIPDTLLLQMDFLSDFAWVSTNAKNYTLAQTILQTVAPRSRIANNPTTNNYLDHYYITRSRIDVLGRNSKKSLYLDSLEGALEQCNNRFDSSYYSYNLANLYAAAGNDRRAYHFLLLNTLIGQRLDNTNVLSGLQKELLNRQLQAAKEKEGRVEEELKNKKLHLFVAGLLLLLLGLLVAQYFIIQRKMAATKATRQQQLFTRVLLQKGEEERKRIATDLHDGINHDLLALKNKLLMGQAVDVVDIEGITGSIRSISRNLFPALFESVGLTASLQSLCERATNAGLFTTCETHYQPVLTKAAELQLYRLIQEALTNVYKHAKAEAAKVTIVVKDKQLWVQIKDNGQGFVVSKVLAGTDSFGLQSMQQRAQVLQAQLSIESNVTGTIITLIKPL